MSNKESSTFTFQNMTLSPLEAPRCGCVPVVIPFGPVIPNAPVVLGELVIPLGSEARVEQDEDCFGFDSE